MGDGATSRRHHPNPAEAEWRWRGGGARRAGVKSAEPWVSRSAKTPHCFVPCSTKTVSQNQPLETAASKPVESPKSVSGDWLPTPEIARNRANSRVSQESKFEPGLVGWGGRIRTSVFWIRPFSQIGHQRLFAHELQTSETQRRSAFGWDRACRSHGHRPRQGAALFVGRAGEQHWVPAIRVFRARGLHAASGLIALRLRIIR